MKRNPKVGVCFYTRWWVLPICSAGSALGKNWVCKRWVYRDMFNLKSVQTSQNRSESDVGRTIDGIGSHRKKYQSVRAFHPKPVRPGQSLPTSTTNASDLQVSTRDGPRDKDDLGNWTCARWFDQPGHWKAATSLTLFRGYDVWCSGSFHPFIHEVQY